MRRGTVLITGTSSGLGLETALHLAQCGFQVYATMRDLDRRKRLDAEAARRNVRLQMCQLDVTDPVSIDNTVSTILAQSGTIDALVNNAGIQLRGYFEDLSETEIRQVFETNLFGSMAVTRAVLPAMRAARCGRIVLVTSIGGRLGSAALSAYCASKFALEGFGEALALESKLLGIEVALVEPAIIKSDIWGANRGVAQAACNANSPYYAWFRAAERLADRLVDSAATTPVDVARIVYRALTAKRPRLRYVAGRRASLVLMLRRYLPGEVFERLYFGAIIRRVTRVGLS